MAEAGSELDDDHPYTPEELVNILTFPSGFLQEPTNSYDEVFPGLYIGDEDAARDIHTLKRLGVTHILNAAHGKDLFMVNTNHVMYRRRDIAFMGVEAIDIATCKMTPHFQKSAEFIGEGLCHGKVLVHCRQGLSRSATLVIAYLMLKQQMRVQDAIRMVRQNREIAPNDGFLEQLCRLDKKLKLSGHFDI